MALLGMNIQPGLLGGQQPSPVMPRVPWGQNPMVTMAGLALLGGRNLNEGFQNVAQMAPAGMAAKSGMQQFMLAQQERDRERKEQEARRNAMNQVIQNWSGLTPEQRQLFTAQPELFGQYAIGTMTPEKPTDDIQEFLYGQQNPEFNEWMTNQKKAGATVVNTGETAETALARSLGTEVAKDLVTRREKANDAALSLQSSQEARKLLDSGIISGFGADWIVGFGKALQQAGFDVASDPIANTEAFVATRAQEVGRIIKLFGAGTGLSDADREFATKAAAGQITLNEASIRRILDINDKAARNVIKSFNTDAAAIDAQKLTPFPLQIELPPETQQAVPAPISVDEWLRQNP